jgi:hypothetical protein
MNCHFQSHECSGDPIHYMGGGIWACFRHFLKAVLGR